MLVPCMQQSSTISELTAYLQEPRIQVDDCLDVKFNILQYWKNSRFTRLALMARDVLAVQASNVAAESTFSVSGRILDDYRSRLTPEHVQMLVCGHIWINLADVNAKGVGVVDLSR